MQRGHTPAHKLPDGCLPPQVISTRQLLCACWTLDAIRTGLACGFDLYQQPRCHILMQSFQLSWHNEACEGKREEVNPVSSRKQESQSKIPISSRASGMPCFMKIKDRGSARFPITINSARIFNRQMNHLWSPWRMAYIESNHEHPGCIFCEQLTQPDGASNLILHRGSTTFVILNRFPYTNGHMMIVPYEHIDSIEELDQATLSELMLNSQRAVKVLRRVYGAQDFNLGMNIGEAAGAGIADHVHIHVLPRWSGDTNFMSTTADTRVLPEALEVSYSRLAEAWKAFGVEG
jgi:ATP adenylyltransferase